VEGRPAGLEPCRGALRRPSPRRRPGSPLAPGPARSGERICVCREGLRG
jgi:hypothetical protein